ncbi:hypothetical protein ACMFGU_09500 [Morganella morganii]|uniref:hypothetical protein n=1 Tax=Morganella morganii TaxID=582 RepID=UPI003CF5BEAF
MWLKAGIQSVLGLVNAQADALRNRSEAVGSIPTLILGGLSFDMGRISAPATNHQY